MSKNKISIVISCDWGIEHDDDDGERYAAYAQTTLRSLYPSHAVDVTYSCDHYGRDSVAIDGSPSDHDVRQILQQCWESWNDSGMP